MNSIVGEIFELFEAYGNVEHMDTLTLLEHSLQTAQFAEADGADENVVCAALLHDIGHAICMEGGCITRKGDDLHEHYGADFLAPWFPYEVSELVRMHVNAKRYLCAVDKDYYAMLSRAARSRLCWQDGKMSADEADSFILLPYVDEAIQLRRYIDQAQVPSLQTKSLEDYADLLYSVSMNALKIPA